MTFNFDLKGELAGLERRRVRAALDLTNIEEQIYQLEGNYLKDTKSSGNLSLGYEAYRGKTKKSSGAVVQRDKKMNKLGKNGRIFSNSSVSSRKTTKGDVETQTSGSKKAAVVKSSKAPSVKTSVVQGLRGKEQE